MSDRILRYENVRALCFVSADFCSRFSKLCCCWNGMEVGCPATVYVYQPLYLRVKWSPASSGDLHSAPCILPRPTVLQNSLSLQHRRFTRTNWLCCKQVRDYSALERDCSNTAPCPRVKGSRRQGCGRSLRNCSSIHRIFMSSTKYVASIPVE